MNNEWVKKFRSDDCVAVADPTMPNGYRLVENDNYVLKNVPIQDGILLCTLSVDEMTCDPLTKEIYLLWKEVIEKPTSLEIKYESAWK